MGGTMHEWARDTEAVAPVDAEAEPGYAEYSAVLAFRVLAPIYIAGVVPAFFSPPGRVAALPILVFNGAAWIFAGVCLIIARGLFTLEPWAVSIARIVLVMVMVQDGWLLVDDVTHGGLHVPIAMFIAGLGLLGPAAVRAIPRPGPFGVLVLLFTAVLLATLMLTQQLSGWGGLLDVHAADLSASVAATCGASGGSDTSAAAAGPRTIHVTYDWAWRKSSPLPSGNDIVVIGWTGDDAGGRPLYLLGPRMPTNAGIDEARQAFPSVDMANAVAATSRGSWQWGVDLHQIGIRPGRIEMDLERTHDPAAGSQPLRIVASYVHLGLWHVDTFLTCEW